MHTLTNQETLEFLRPYLAGIKRAGLLEPLLKIAETASAQVSLAAKSFYSIQMAGIAPQAAVFMVQPALPYRVAHLIAAGFEQSNLDYVLADTIKILESDRCDADIEKSLYAVLEKHSNLTTEETCIHCASEEIEKLKRRSEVEGASLVVVDYSEGFLRQRFVSTKLVEVKTAAIPAVYATLKQTLKNLSVDLKNDDRTVASLSEFAFKVETSSRSLIIEFVN